VLSGSPHAPGPSETVSEVSGTISYVSWKVWPPLLSPRPGAATPTLASVRQCHPRAVALRRSSLESSETLTGQILDPIPCLRHPVRTPLLPEQGGVDIATARSGRGVFANTDGTVGD
jgi:hypothetical protein